MYSLRVFLSGAILLTMHPENESLARKIEKKKQKNEIRSKLYPFKFAIIKITSVKINMYYYPSKARLKKNTKIPLSALTSLFLTETKLFFSE